MFKGACHCGNIKFELANTPEQLTDCNCSICRRLGVLWAYVETSEIKVVCDSGAIIDYSWGDKTLAFCTCAKCGCTTHWKSLDSDTHSKMAVNAKMAEPENIKGIRIRHFDGADTFKYLD